MRDLGHAQIQSANGKLGSLGKRVEVQGHSSSTGLDELLTVEVYDDFPSLALLSASYKNSGEKEIVLDKVALQNHTLNASLADSNAKSHEMWAFFGSSIRWGKDDVLPIPAKFSQDNPFGAPVETRDDLGRVGGGVPVVAFWTRNMGLQSGIWKHYRWPSPFRCKQRPTVKWMQPSMFPQIRHSNWARAFPPPERS